MARPSIPIRQRDFSSGVIDFDGRRRDDTKIYRSALREGTNMRPLSAGGIVDRPGRHWQYFNSGGRPGWARPMPGVRHKIDFGDGTFTARNTDNTANTTLAGCPWTADMLPDLSWCMADDVIVVAHVDIPPQVIQYDADAGEWTRFEFSFQEELNGDIRQPYYRFAAGGITMTPSALTGTGIDVAFSADVLVADHVGKRFRYFDFEIEIATVTDAQNGTADVIRALPGTWRITVGSTTGFGEGDAVEGATTGATGVVAAIVSSTQMDVVLETPGAGFSATEVIIGPTGRSTASAQSSVDPAAFTIWDEQLISDVRGYPAGVNFDRSRLMFFGFPQVGRAILWSEIGVIDGFNIGALATDGMFETMPLNCTVEYVDGGSDQFVYTDVGVFYIPISSASPLEPGSVEFREISSEGAAPIAPARTMDGAVFVNNARNRILALRATGQTAQPYVVEDIAEFHRDLFSSPIGIALSTGSSGQELVYVLNDDGTMVAGKLNRGEQLVGWFPWEGEGSIRYLAADRGDVLFAVSYAADAGTVYTIEEEDEDALVDCIMDADDTASLQDFAGLSVAVFESGVYGGSFEIGVDGSLTGWGGVAADSTVGFAFEARVMPFIGNIDAAQALGQGMTLRSVKKAAVTFNSTAAEIEFCGRLHSAYRALDDEGAAAPERNMTKIGRVAGRSYEPEIPLRRYQPGRLKIVEFACEVTI